jgi:capsule biosynthesis phosphatase
MKRLVLDLDGTITREDPNRAYVDKEPDHDVVARIREYKALGFAIIIYTARSMRSFNNSVGMISAHTLPVIINWLNTHNIPYDEIHVGKPWCGTEGFYVDDRAIRPSEFIRLSFTEIKELIELRPQETVYK